MQTAVAGENFGVSATFAGPAEDVEAMGVKSKERALPEGMAVTLVQALGKTEQDASRGPAIEGAQLVVVFPFLPGCLAPPPPELLLGRTFLPLLNPSPADCV